MAMQRRLDELQAECTKLHLVVNSNGKRESKQDYIDALAKHFYENDPRKGQYGFEFMLAIQSPMLCQRINYLKEHEQKEIMREGSDWLFEKKLDGARILITYHPEEGFDFYSRNISVQDFLPISYQDTVWLGEKDWRHVFKTPFVIDAEVISASTEINTVLGNRGVVTATQLQATTALMAMDPSRSIPLQKETGGFKFHVFDVLKAGQFNLMAMPLIERRKVLEKLYEALEAKGFPMVRVAQVKIGKQAYLDSILDKGGEGCVAKHLQSVYTASESRGRQGWVKIKRAQTLAGGDNIDAFVTGFLPGATGSGWETMVGSLEVSVYLHKKNGEIVQHQIAAVSNIPMEERIRMTDHDANGNPILRPEYYGRVVEVTGQDISARARRLTHAAIVLWRPDRSNETCNMTEEELDKGIL